MQDTFTLERSDYSKFCIEDLTCRSLRSRFLIISSKLKPRNNTAAIGMREIMNQAIPVSGLSLDHGETRFSCFFVCAVGASALGTTNIGNAVSLETIGKSVLATCKPRFSHVTSEKTFFPAWSMQTLLWANEALDTKIKDMLTKISFIFRLLGSVGECGADDIRATIRRLLRRPSLIYIKSWFKKQILC